MASLTDQIASAITDLQAGKFNGNVVSLLRRAHERIMQQKAERKEAALHNTKATFEAYRKLHDRLQEIGRAFIEARFPKAETIYLTRWNLFQYGRDQSQPEMIDLSMEWRRYERADDEDENDCSHDGTGRGYRQMHFNVIIEAKWLWDEEGWQKAVKLAGLEAELKEAEKRRDGLNEAISKQRDHVDEMSERLKQTVEHAGRIEAEIRRVKEGA